MSEPESARERADVVTEITTSLRRAGLRVGEAEIAAMAETHLFVRRGLEVLRNRLPKTTEPAPIFDASASWRSADSGDDHAGR
jgi:hypothetical protein